MGPTDTVNTHVPKIAHKDTSEWPRALVLCIQFPGWFIKIRVWMALHFTIILLTTL